MSCCKKGCSEEGGRKLDNPKENHSHKLIFKTKSENQMCKQTIREKLLQLTNFVTPYFKGDMASVGSFIKGAEFVLRYLIGFHKMKVCNLYP